MRPKVKVCGITNLEDALLCYQAGAAALGFIFVPGSPRCLTPEEAKQITQKLPPFCERIGVFANQTPELVQQTVQKAQLSMVQLHGQEDTVYLQKLVSLVLVPVIKALRLTSLRELEAQIAELNFDYLTALLIDGPGGVKIDPALYRKASELIPLPVIYAGALSKKYLPTNQDGLFDLCSSLEAEPGKKDPKKVREFFAALALRGES